ncbi:NVEALA family protein [Bacteroides fragilis str. 3719 T6]|nr:NVEALA family protein [Bacteroides fragilis str. 3719 T6]
MFFFVEINNKFMRKKIGILLVVVMALVTGYNIYRSQSDNLVTDLMMENIEALASSEWGSSSCHWDLDISDCFSWAKGTYCYCGL